MGEIGREAVQTRSGFSPSHLRFRPKGHRRLLPVEGILTPITHLAIHGPSRIMPVPAIPQPTAPPGSTTIAKFRRPQPPTFASPEEEQRFAKGALVRRHSQQGASWDIH